MAVAAPDNAHVISGPGHGDDLHVHRAWNEYVVALTLIIDDSKKPLTVGFRSYVTGYEQNWDQLFAASVIAVVPVVILFALIEKHLVGGLTAGSVK